MGELVLEEHLAAVRAEEPQELSIGLDQPERSLEVLVGAREESLDDPACGPENHEYVGRLGLAHLPVRPGVDRPRGVDLHVRRDDRLERFAGVLRRGTAGPLLRTEKPVKLLLQLLRVALVALAGEHRRPRGLRAKACQQRLLRRVEPFAFQKQLLVQVRDELVHPLRHEDLSEALEVLARDLVTRVLPVEELDQIEDVGGQKEDSVRNPFWIAQPDGLRLAFPYGEELQVTQLGTFHLEIIPRVFRGWPSPRQPGPAPSAPGAPVPRTRTRRPKT